MRELIQLQVSGSGMYLKEKYCLLSSAGYLLPLEMPVNHVALHSHHGVKGGPNQITETLGPSE